MNENETRNRTNNHPDKDQHLGIEIGTAIKFMLSMYDINSNSYTHTCPAKSTIEAWAQLGLVKVEGNEMQLVLKDITFYGKSREFKAVPYGLVRLFGDFLNHVDLIYQTFC